MTEKVEIGDATLITADVIEGLRSLPDESVQCVVTSPPYWGLRDYGTATWEGGDPPECDHKIPNTEIDPKYPQRTSHNARFIREKCYKCGAVRIDRMIGLESTFAEWLDRMVAVCEEIKRVLRSDGTFWLNCGDAYASGGGTQQPQRDTSGGFGGRDKGTRGKQGFSGASGGYERPSANLKPKDLMMMPARLAIALQEAGWWIRSEIIWAKPNPMPESVTDRPTSSHEKIYLLTKSARYYYDADAVRETSADPERTNFQPGKQVFSDGYREATGDAHRGFKNCEKYIGAGRNLRNVWTIATQPYPEAHFATFPEALPMKCIMAGTSERGCCPECGAPWERMTEKGEPVLNAWSSKGAGQYDDKLGGMRRTGLENGSTLKHSVPITTLGWQPSCECKHHPADGPMIPYDPIPCTVLDPFSGSATTGLVALKLNRRYIGIELNPDYVQLSIKRIQNEADQVKLFQ